MWNIMFLTRKVESKTPKPVTRFQCFISTYQKINEVVMYTSRIKFSIIALSVNHGMEYLSLQMRVKKLLVRNYY